MRRDIHEGELRRAYNQDETRLVCVHGKRPLKKAAEHVLDLAEPAQRRRCNGAGESAVSEGKRGERRLRAQPGESIVESLSVMQHGLQETRGELPRLKARSFPMRLYALRFQASYPFPGSPISAQDVTPIV